MAQSMPRLSEHISTVRAQKKSEDGTEPEDQAIGRSRGRLSTKLHATCDALGNPTGFFLSGGQAHDLEGADALLDNFQGQALLADKVYDADERVRQRLVVKGCEAVIPSKANRKPPDDYDKHLYKARHEIENFFARLKQY